MPKIKSDYIKKLIKEQGLNQRSVAAKLGVSYSTISQSLITFAMGENLIKRLAELLGVDPVTLLAMNESGDEKTKASISEASVTLGRLLERQEQQGTEINTLKEAVRGINERLDKLKGLI